MPMKAPDDRFEQQLRDAVRMSAPVLPDAFEQEMGQLIEHLPRKERSVMKRKLSLGLVLALMLCLLTAGAVAVALLTNEELVEQLLVPMAQENDASGLNETFTHEELGVILALAEENGIHLDANGHISEAYAAGEGYWEEEVIMAIAKEAFGPYPGQWTLEEQYWFEEMAVAIGFKAVNYARIPGEGDLTYEAAYALAKAYIGEEYGPSQVLRLDDRASYDLWRGYHAYPDEAGILQEPTWYFWFEPKDISLTEYELTMSRTGEVLSCKIQQTLASLMEETAGVMSYEIRDRFERCYGTQWDWSPETWVSYGQWLDRALDADTCLQAQAVYLLPPEGSLTMEAVCALALDAADDPDSKLLCAVCMADGDCPIWKVTLRDGNNERIFLELDCLTGAVRYEGRDHQNLWYAPFMPERQLTELYQEPSPEGLG